MLTRLALLVLTVLVAAVPAFAQVRQDGDVVRLIEVPFNAGDFTTNGDKTWTVQQADVQTHAYGAIGKLRFYTLDIINADIGAGSTGNQMIIQLPFTVARRATAPAIILNATVRVGDSRCVILINTSQLLCTLNSIAVFTTSTQGAGVQVQIVLEVP